jgi:hypothetical protein
VLAGHTEVVRQQLIECDVVGFDQRRDLSHAVLQEKETMDRRTATHKEGRRPPCIATRPAWDTVFADTTKATSDIERPAVRAGGVLGEELPLPLTDLPEALAVAEVLLRLLAGDVRQRAAPRT